MEQLVLIALFEFARRRPRLRRCHLRTYLTTAVRRAVMKARMGELRHWGSRRSPVAAAADALGLFRGNGQIRIDRRDELEALLSRASLRPAGSRSLVWRYVREKLGKKYGNRAALLRARLLNFRSACENPKKIRRCGRCRPCRRREKWSAAARDRNRDALGHWTSDPRRGRKKRFVSRRRRHKLGASCTSR